MGWIWHRKRPQVATDNWDQAIPTVEDEISAALTTWERRGRGYDLYAVPVELEPVFLPLQHLSPTALGEPTARPLRTAGTRYIGLPLAPPPGQKITLAQVESLLQSGRGLAQPFAFEIISTGCEIVYQLAVPESAAAELTTSLATLCGMPESLFIAAESATADLLQEHWIHLPQGPLGIQVVDFGLYHPVYQPLKQLASWSNDPQTAILTALSRLNDGELAGVQVLLQPAGASWAPAFTQLVALYESSAGQRSQGQVSHPALQGRGALQRQAALKFRTPLWVAQLRVWAVSPAGSSRTLALCRAVASALEMLAEPEGNHLVALDDSGYADDEHWEDVLQRVSRRTGMLLSSAELVGLVHPPTELLTHRKLRRHDPRERALPEHLRDATGILLGQTVASSSVASSAFSSGGAAEPLFWPQHYRNRHLYMLGATRMGKSTLLLNMIAQDLQQGNGLCLIDPHGDLALDVLRRVPPEREADVFYLDLSDRTHPPALGLLEASDDWEKRLLVSDLLAILHRLFRASWGDRLEHILRHALLTLLAAQSSPFGTPLTLRDIRPLLASKAYREQLLEKVPDLDLRTFWHSEFPGYASSAFAPVYNKLGLLLSSPLVRNIVGGSASRLHAGELMRQRRVLLVNLAQSLIGEDNAHFLGALLVSKIQLAAMHNLRIGREERTPFTLYVDEFQNFVVSSFGKILSEAGKAGLSLVMANQFLEQLGEDLPTAIRSNTGALISFRVSAQSGRALEGEFGGHFGAQELTDLERGEAVARIGRASDSFLLQTAPPPEAVETSPGAVERILSQTYHRICRERTDVEAELRQADETLHALLQEVAAPPKRHKKNEPPAAGISGTQEPTEINARPISQASSFDIPSAQMDNQPANATEGDDQKRDDSSVQREASLPLLFFGVPDVLEDDLERNEDESTNKSEMAGADKQTSDGEKESDVWST